MHNRGNSPFHCLTTWFLNGLSVIFKIISLINLKVKSLKTIQYPEVYIVSIDNLSFGGTGKTTMVVEICKYLEQQQIKFAIILRGYRSMYEKEGVTVSTSHTSRDVGDEAKMLKNQFPQNSVYVGKNRYLSIKRAIADGNKVIILDDGFQTSGLYKDVKIMLFNPQHRYYYLRNFKFLMKQEDYVFVYQPANSANEANINFKSSSGTPISSHFSAQPVDWKEKPVYGTYHFQQEGFYSVTGESINVKEKALLGFSALGDNLRFKTDLSAFHLVGFRSFRDHHSYTKSDIEQLNEEKEQLNADFLVCTEKDYIKIKHLNLLQIPLIYSKNSIKLSFDLMGRVLIKDARAKNKI